MSREYLEAEEREWEADEPLDETADEETENENVPRSGRRRLSPLERLQ